MTTNVLLVGVGGQGILLAARIIARAAETAGFEVTTHEIHGMAQRGGSVSAQVRYGGKLFSPLMAEGSADVLGALEPVEALRFSHWLKPEGFAAVSVHPVIPVTVSTGRAAYPENFRELLAGRFARLKLVDCERLAVEHFKDIRLANTILLGALSNGLELPQDAWNQAMAACVKPAFAAANRSAFEEGRKL